MVWNGSASGATYNAAWLNENGEAAAVFPNDRNYLSPKISPDGRFLAIAAGDPSGNIQIWDPARESLTQLTFGNDDAMYPIFTPDARRLVYSTGESHNVLWWVRADGGGTPQKLYESPGLFVPCSFSPDGRRLAYFTIGNNTRQDIWTLPIDTSDPDHPKAGSPEPFLQTPNGESSPMFSPDGHWIAYNSDESGRMDVYVRPFPGPGGKWLVSSGGGIWASWSSDGKRLFYRTTDGQIMAVDYVAAGGVFRAGKPRNWSEFHGIVPHQPSTFRNWDMSPDGRRAVMLSESQRSRQAPPKLSVVLNLFDELKRRLP